MTETGPIDWPEMIRLMTSVGPSGRTIRGIVVSGRRARSFGLAGAHPAPLIAHAMADESCPVSLHVTCAGRRLRLERHAGTPTSSSGRTAPGCSTKIPIVPTRTGPQIAFAGDIMQLTRRPTLERFVGTDFTTPTGPVVATSFLGRPAWEVELAPPRSKPYPLQWVVDAQTGQHLQQRNDGFGTRAEWIESRSSRSTRTRRSSRGPARSALASNATPKQRKVMRAGSAGVMSG